jgi:GT2 family glycosyltransferase
VCHFLFNKFHELGINWALADAKLHVVAHAPIVDIIITVKTNVRTLRKCVNSLIRQAPDRAVLKQRVIFVDDGSPSETLNYEKLLCDNNPEFVCLETSVRGYTHAVVQGIEYGAGVSEAIVLLNSDTVVTRRWLDRLYSSLMQNVNKQVMIVGPLSNAASFQSVPETRKYDTLKKRYQDWSTNPLPVGMNIDMLASEVTRLSREPGASAEMPLMILNGFCFMFNRKLISVIGNFDKTHFPSGYGEEVDFSIRAAKAGFEGRVVASSYVYHAKTASFTSTEKQILKKSSRQTLMSLYGDNFFADFNKRSQNMLSLDSIRSGVQSYYKTIASKYADAELPGSILFALHDLGFAGGIISILSEAYQMMQYGVNVSISVPETANKGDPFAVARAVLQDASEEELRRLIITHAGENMEPAPVSPQFIDIAKSFDIVIATYCKVSYELDAFALLSCGVDILSEPAIPSS